MSLPARIADGVLEAGGRSLRLPPGHWVLTGRGEVETVGHARGGDAWGQGVSAWATLVDHGRLRAIVWLSLPLQDFARVRAGAPGCAENDAAIERLNLSNQLSKPECLAVYGERDLQSALAIRSPNTLKWLVRHHVADPGPLVRFVYKLRSDSSYGSFALLLPTGPFDSDDEARRWALGLRDSLRAFLEHRTSEARVPALPGETSSGSASAR
ncbi:MAG TPA: hypothetical protein VIP05_23905 [Burkholderiaceae bacterium]